jgi:hypothetical protein
MAKLEKDCTDSIKHTLLPKSNDTCYISPVMRTPLCESPQRKDCPDEDKPQIKVLSTMTIDIQLIDLPR